MDPLVYRDAPAAAAFNITALIWLASELRIVTRNRGGTGENLDMGSRVWVVALIGIGMGAAVALAWQGGGRLAGWWPVAVGLPVALGGIALRLWSVATLGAFFTTAVEVQAHHRIIDTGPYKRLRHPSYSGTLLTVVGMSLALGSWFGCIVAAALALAGIAQRVRVEERALASRLGPAWTAFARHRRRFIPFVW